jgi:hypothetical protein
VAVLRYGGWAETLRDGVTVLPPTAVPSEGAERGAFFTTLVSALEEKLPFRYTGCDLNAPFSLEDGVLDLLQKRQEEGRTHPVLIVVLSACGFQAVEILEKEGKPHVVARKDYLDEALKNSGDANRESINAEAVRIFSESVPGALRAHADVKVLAVHTGKAPRAAEDPLGLLVPDGRLLDLERGGLEGLLSALASSFPAVPAALKPWAVETGEVAADAPGRHEIQVVQGTRALALAIWGPPQTTFSLKAPDGSEPTEGEGVHVFGRGGRFRVILLSPPVPGLYELSVGVDDEAPAGPFTVAAFRDLSYRLEVEVRGERDILYSGDVVPVGLAATWGDPPSPVTEGITLEKMQVEITVKGPAGKPEPKIVGFGQRPESTLEVPVRLGSGDWEGAVGLTAVLRAFPREDGSHEFVSPPVTLSLNVIPGSAAFEITFRETSVLTHQEARLDGKPLRGRPPEGPLEIQLVPEEEGEPLTVTLFGGDVPGVMWGKVRSAAPGTWKITARKGGPGVPALIPGPQSTLAVRARSVALEVKEGGAFRTVEEAGVPFFLVLPEGETQGGHFFVSGDLAPGEEGAVRIESAELKGWKLKVYDGEKELPAEGRGITGDSPRAELRIVLEPVGDPPDVGVHAVGKIVPVLLLPGLGEEGAPLEVRGEAVLKADVRAGPPPWFMNPILWGIAGALLLLLLLLVWLFTGSKFEYQNLVLQGEEGVGRAPFFFIDNTTGFKKRRAFGTEELEKTIQVKVKGGGRCYVTAGSGDVDVRVNGRKIAGYFALSDGNLVDIRLRDQACSYRYYSKPTAPEDLADDEFVLMEYDQDDDFVIAEEEEVPEYVPAAAGEEGPATEAAQHGWVDDDAPEPAGQATEETPPEEGAYGPDAEEAWSEEPEDLGAGTLEEIEPQGDMQMEDLITAKPPTELVTADPLTFTDDVQGEIEGEESDQASGMDDGATLMGISSDGEISSADVPEAAEPEPQAAGGEGLDDAVTLMGITSDGLVTEAQVRKEMKPAEEAADFDDMDTFLGEAPPEEEEAGEAEDEEEEEGEEE